MAQFVKKENLTISIGEYERDGQTKKQWRTIGEIITMNGDDGNPYQFFKLWGAGGVVEGKVFEQQENQGGQQQQQMQQQPQQQQMQQQPQQQQPPQQSWGNPPPQQQQQQSAPIQGYPQQGK